MKIRNGFVSNSSSASYIVKVLDIKVKEFYDLIAEEFQYDYFDIRDLKEVFLKHIKEMEEHPLTFNWVNAGIRKYKELVSCIEVFEKLKKDYAKEGNDDNDGNDDNGRYELYEKILNVHYGVYIQELESGVILTGSSIMHNSLADVPELLKAICIYCLFNNKKIECELEDDECR